MDKKKNRGYSEIFIKLANQLDLASTRSEQLFRTILESVARTLNAEQVSIWRFSQTNLEMQCVALHGRTAAGKPQGRIDLSTHILYLMALQTEPSIAVPNVAQDQRFVPLPKDAGISPGIKSSLHVPMRMINKVLGILRVDSCTTREWAEEEVQLCSQIANIIAQVLSQEARSQADMIKRLSSEISSLNRPISLEKIIPMIGQGAVRLLNADKLALVLREQKGIVRASWVTGLVKHEIAGVVEKEGDQLLDMFGSMEPILIPSISDSQLPPSFKRSLSFEEVTSARITPIIQSRNIIGLIIALDETPTDWPDWEMAAMETFANAAALTLQSIWLCDQLERGYLDLALSLANTVDARESDFRAASMQLAEWCQQTAQLLGLSEEEHRLIRWAALLHDIGKVEIPDEVLQKPGPLDLAERKLIERYPLKSEQLLRPSSRYQKVGTVLRYIHERFDGQGYPDKKKGEDIPLPARILAVADAYASMIENRPYRRAYSHEQAVEEIRKNSGTQFDPAVVRAFLETVSNLEPTP